MICLKICDDQHVFSQLFLSKTSNFLLSGQRINLNIGQLWLGTASQSYNSINHITTIHQPAIIAKRNEVARDESCYNRADNSKVRLTRDDRAEDLKKLENDSFFLSNNDERITISNQDEAVLNHYRNTVEEIKLDNGETHLQFRLPWAKDPTIMKDNFKQAKDALLRKRKKLSSQPDLKSKYCEKIKSAIAAGHIVKLSNESKDTITPRYYLPHFNTTQTKFRVVYDAARDYYGTSLNQLLA